MGFRAIRGYTGIRRIQNVKRAVAVILFKDKTKEEVREGRHVESMSKNVTGRQWRIRERIVSEN